MITCHECGSEVTEKDGFCPFCGISLQPVVPPVELEQEPGDALESTIMMAPEEIARLSKGAAPKSDETPFEDPASGDSESSAAQPDELAATDEVPIPELLSDIVNTSDNIPVRSTSDYAAGELESGHAGDVEAAGTEPAKNTAASSASEITPGPPDTELPEWEPDEPMTTAGPPISTETSGEGIEASEGAVASAPGQIDGPEDRAERDLSMASDQKEEDRKEPGPEPPAAGIARPADELEPHDPFKSGSMFDSVRIMENDYPDLQENIDTKLGMPYPASETKDEGTSKPDLPGEKREAAEPRPQTTPNIGEGDTDGRKSAKLKPLAEGTVLGSRYEIIRKIGGGGMGAVYLASDNNLGGVLRAVKEMVQAHIEDEQQEKAINDFKRESMILSTLDHPSIPTIFDYFYDEVESRFYLVMKYISGGDLATRLRAAPEGKLDERTVTDWAIQITDVLDYLHSQPTTIVYRDLKPSNIMVDANSGRVMLIDFGIARSISQREEKGVTAVGTMGYAPPELFSGNVEPRSDIYSLGSTMFHLLTGADPQSNPLLIFDFQKNPRPRQINPQLSDQMERILMQAVEYNADARFASAAEMRRILTEHLDRLSAGDVSYGVSAAPEAVSLANQAVFCGFCGQRIVATDLFCAFCGSKQPIAQQGVHSGVYSKPGVTAKLFVEGTSDLAAPTFSLQKDENLVGRRDPMSNIFPEVDLSKYDPQTKISRRHARIWRDGGNYLVEDLGSSNGTILAPAQKEALRLVPHRPHAITSGDKLKIGDTTLHFLVG